MDDRKKATRPATTRFICSGLLIIWLCVAGAPVSAQETDKASSGDEIVVVDIPYALFVSLARYEDLTEAERQGQPVASELVPVLETIVDTLKKERDRFEPLLARTSDGDIRECLARMDRLIEDYENELRYRRKAMALERLLEQQESLLDGE